MSSTSNPIYIPKVRKAAAECAQDDKRGDNVCVPCTNCPFGREEFATIACSKKWCCKCCHCELCNERVAIYVQKCLPQSPPPKRPRRKSTPGVMSPGPTPQAEAANMSIPPVDWKALSTVERSYELYLQHYRVWDGPWHLLDGRFFVSPAVVTDPGGEPITCCDLRPGDVSTRETHHMQILYDQLGSEVRLTGPVACLINSEQLPSCRANTFPSCWSALRCIHTMGLPNTTTPFGCVAVTARRRLVSCLRSIP
jgi:hypothetical protein